MFLRRCTEEVLLCLLYFVNKFVRIGRGRLRAELIEILFDKLNLEQDMALVFYAIRVGDANLKTVFA